MRGPFFSARRELENYMMQTTENGRFIARFSGFRENEKMKKLTWITHTLACLMIVLAALGALLGAVHGLATDAFFYGGMSRMAVAQSLGAQHANDVSSQITAYIGMDDAQQDVFAKDMVSFMKKETDELPQVLGDKERQHMRDVRTLVALAQTVSKGLMTIAAGLAVVIAWTGAQGKHRGMPFGTLIGVLVIATIGAVAYFLLQTQGFEALFVRFHEIAFTNELWLMNPETDILIRMMPQTLFEQAGKEVLRRALIGFTVTDLLLMSVHLIVGGMIRRQLAKND